VRRSGSTSPRNAGREDEERPTADIIELAQQYGRYGDRKVAARLRQDQRQAGPAYLAT